MPGACHLKRQFLTGGGCLVLTLLYDHECKILPKFWIQTPSFSPPLNPCLTLLHPPKIFSPLYSHPTIPLIILYFIVQNNQHLFNMLHNVPTTIIWSLSLEGWHHHGWSILGLQLLRVATAWCRHLIHIYYVCWYICIYAAFSWTLVGCVCYPFDVMMTRNNLRLYIGSQSQRV